MKELIKVFGETPLNIKIIDDENFYVDISGIAKDHGKNISAWKHGKKNKAYIKSLQKLNNLNETEMIRQVGNTTLIHNKLLVLFARYISADFAVFCDNIIYEMITNNSQDAIQREVFKIKGEVMAEFDKYLPPSKDYNTPNDRGMLRLKPIRGYYRAESFQDNKDALRLFQCREMLKEDILFPEVIAEEAERLENSLRDSQTPRSLQ